MQHIKEHRVMARGSAELLVDLLQYEHGDTSSKRCWKVRLYETARSRE